MFHKQKLLPVIVTVPNPIYHNEWGFEPSTLKYKDWANRDNTITDVIRMVNNRYRGNWVKFYYKGLTISKDLQL